MDLGVLNVTAKVETYEVVVSVVAVGLYACAEIWCIIAMYISLKSRSWYDDISMVAFYGSLNLTLLFRGLYFLSYAQLIVLPRYWFYYVSNLPAISKDITMACLTCRVFDAISMHSDDRQYPRLIRATYGFLLVHVSVIYIWVVCNGYSNGNVQGTFVYMVTMQSVLSAIFLYSLIRFFMMRKDMDQENKGSLVILWLTIILSYMLFVIVFRIVYNALALSGFVDEMGTMGYLVLYSITNLLTELIPCILIITLLFYLSRLTGAISESFSGPIPLSLPSVLCILHSSPMPIHVAPGDIDMLLPKGSELSAIMFTMRLFLEEGEISGEEEAATGPSPDEPIAS